MNSKIIVLLSLVVAGVVSNEFTDAKTRLLQASTGTVTSTSCSSTMACAPVTTTCMSYTKTTPPAAASTQNTCIPNDFVSAYSVAGYSVVSSTTTYASFTLVGPAGTNSATTVCTDPANCTVSGQCCAIATSTIVGV